MEANISRGRSRSRKAGLGRLAALAGVVALVAVACGGSKVTPETIYVTLPPSTPEATATPVVTAEPSGSASASATAAVTPAGPAPTVSSTTVTSTAPDGRWTATFEKPVVGGVATVAAMNASITTKVNSYISSFTGSGLPAVVPPDGKSTIEGSFTVAYVSPTLLSLRFSATTFVSGAAHPVTETGSFNFNVLTGTVIQLPDLFTSTAAALPVRDDKGPCPPGVGAWVGPVLARLDHHGRIRQRLGLHVGRPGIGLVAGRDGADVGGPGIGRGPVGSAGEGHRQPRSRGRFPGGALGSGRTR